MRALLTALGVCRSASVAGAAPMPRECLFERQIVDRVSRNVALAVAIVADGARGSVAVQGSGTCDATVRGSQMRFRTPISTGTITVGAGGEAFWTIAFDTGGAMAHAGRCGPARAG